MKGESIKSKKVTEIEPPPLQFRNLQRRRLYIIRHKRTVPLCFIMLMLASRLR
jgi:hypothetical protein